VRALPRWVFNFSISRSRSWIMVWHRSNQTSKRLHYIPGSVRCWRPPWSRVLLTPAPSDQDVTSRPGLGSFPNSTQVGARDRYLRGLFVAGALAVIRYAKIHGTGHRPWLRALLGRRPTKVAAIALANKIARMAWAMMAKGERYKNPLALAR
jgi:transposase